MSASLVGSEMCIRDRRSTPRGARRAASARSVRCPHERAEKVCRSGPVSTCLLYTSDAADDM
eukprot:2878964-Alexandrium_andersonii.AAC.1